MQAEPYGPLTRFERFFIGNARPGAGPFVTMWMGVALAIFGLGLFAYRLAVPSEGEYWTGHQGFLFFLIGQMTAMFGAAAIGARRYLLRHGIRPAPQEYLPRSFRPAEEKA